MNKKKLGLDIPMEKQAAQRRYYYHCKILSELINAKADVDDIDHLLQEQLRTTISSIQ
jgi:DNA-directed RNA polymerase subunit beta